MTISTPLFTKINESFSCLNCGFDVPKSQSTCRDHCPKCLYSLHVDDSPGDRANPCHGLLVPQSWYTHKKKGIMISYECKACKTKKVNKFLERDNFIPDDFNALLKLSAHENH